MIGVRVAESANLSCSDFQPAIRIGRRGPREVSPTPPGVPPPAFQKAHASPATCASFPGRNETTIGGCPGAVVIDEIIRPPARDSLR